MPSATSFPATIFHNFPALCTEKNIVGTEKMHWPGQPGLEFRSLQDVAGRPLLEGWGCFEWRDRQGAARYPDGNGLRTRTGSPDWGDRNGLERLSGGEGHRPRSAHARVGGGKRAPAWCGTVSPYCLRRSITCPRGSSWELDLWGTGLKCSEDQKTWALARNMLSATDVLPQFATLAPPLILDPLTASLR